MIRIKCKKCKCKTFSNEEISDFKCAPCNNGFLPSKLECVACGEKNGIFLLDLSRHWIHHKCLYLLEDYIIGDRKAALSLIKSTDSHVNIRIPRKILKKACSKCNEIKNSVLIKCNICEKIAHISCFKSESSTSCGCDNIPIKRARTFHKDSNNRDNHDTEDIRKELKNIPKDASLNITVDWILNLIVEKDWLLYFRKNSQKNFLEKIRKPNTGDFYYNPDEKSLYLILKRNGKDKYGFQKDQNHKKIEETESNGNKLYLNKQISEIDSLDYILNNSHIFSSTEQIKIYLHHLKVKKLREANSSYEIAYIRRFRKNYNFILDLTEDFITKSLISDWEKIKELNKRNYARVEGEWHKEPFKSRKYEIINDYVPADNKFSIDQITTEKIGRCDGVGCDYFLTLGEYNIQTCQFASTNDDRKNRIECSNYCKCSKDVCKNRQIANKERLKLKRSVKQVETWGYDIYTYKVLWNLLGTNDESVDLFLSKKLPKAINLTMTYNWDIKRSLVFILCDTNSIFKDDEKNLALRLNNIISALINIYGEEKINSELKIHPKGTGAICQQKGGIQMSSLITEYLGEIYSPAIWYERQDIIKQINFQMHKQKKRSQKNMPDFYNILLDRHKDDPSGYDLLMIDPMVKGNYVSRLSHSCDPNCGTVTMVSKGRYTVGMYALRDIEYLEELTFDYNSYTDSVDEYLRSVCLCSSSLCRSYYVLLANNTITHIPDYKFLQRVSTLVKSSCQKLDKESTDLLDKYSIKSSVLNGCPVWLKKWISLALHDIDNQLKKLIESGVNDVTIESTQNSRIQNLVISISKAKYFLINSDSHAPVSILDKKGALKHIWGNEPNSIKSELRQLNKALKINKLKSLLSESIKSLHKAQLQLLKIRDLLRRSGDNNWKFSGLADVLHLIAYTRIFFEIEEYRGFTSDNIKIYRCEITKDALNSDPLENFFSRTYSKTHIHEILLNWYRQKVGGRRKSLTKLMSGYLILPSISEAPRMLYDDHIRIMFLDKIRGNSADSWKLNGNEDFPWNKSFSNSNVLGSPMFDRYFMDPQAVEKCLADIDIKAEQCHIPGYFNNNS